MPKISPAAAFDADKQFGSSPSSPGHVAPGSIRTGNSSSFTNLAARFFGSSKPAEATSDWDDRTTSKLTKVGYFSQDFPDKDFLGEPEKTKPRTMFGKKLFLLLWKNWLIRWRHPVLFFVEIGAVALFFGILLLVKIQLASNAGSVLESNTTIFATWDESMILNQFSSDIPGNNGRGTRKLLQIPGINNTKTFMYAPNTSPEVVGIMERFAVLTGNLTGKFETLFFTLVSGT